MKPNGETQLPRPAAPAGKMAYQPPSLVRYGGVRDLTQAFTGIDPETGKPGNCSQNWNKKPCN